MDLTALLIFAPAAIGLVWLGYLIFNKNLAEDGLGNILTYFIGVIIMFVAVGWLVDYFFFSWINERLEEAEGSTEALELRNRSERILRDAFDEPAEETLIVVPSATPVQIVVTATPGSGGRDAAPEIVPHDPNRGPVPYTVKTGDTLVEIARQYGVTYSEIMLANNLYSTTIYPGQVLVIPAPTQN